MNRFPAVLAAAFAVGLTLPLALSAQTTPPPGYATPGAAQDPYAVMALRSEVATMRAEVKEASRLYAEIKDMLTQLGNRQQGIYVQIANLSQSQVDKDAILRSAKTEIENLNVQIQQARTDMGALERRMAEARAAPAASYSPGPIASPVSAPEIVASAQIAPALEQQCIELRKSSTKAWQRVIPQILTDYVFEEIDRPNGRVWARKDQSSQGFVYNDVMRKIGCEP